MFLAKWISVILAAVTWGIVFLLIRPGRIRELLPVGLIAAMVLFATDEVLITLKVIGFRDGFLPVAGQPLFHLVWGAGGGILLMNYISEEFSKKIPMILLFGIATIAFEYLADATGAYTHATRFTYTHDFIIDIFSLVFLVWISEGMYGKIIHSRGAGLK